MFKWLKKLWCIHNNAENVGGDYIKTTVGKITVTYWRCPTCGKEWRTYQ